MMIFATFTPNPCIYAPPYGFKSFKGVLVRNLGVLNAVTGRYSGYLTANAACLWASGRNGSNLFGFYWDAPPAFYLPSGGEAPIEGAALDLLTTQIRDGGGQQRSEGRVRANA